MTFPEWTKPGLYGALGGVIAISVLGFTYGGWVTGATARDMAQDHASKEVTLAMVPFCLDLSTTDPERVEKLATIQDASGFGRRQAMMETGWATLPGSDTPNRALAAACVAQLEVNSA